MGIFSKDIKTLDDLFVHQLKDIYYAEKQLVKALPKMAEKATSPQLKQAFQSHLEETKGHVARVEQVFKMHGVEAKAVDCPAIDGIIEEANEVAGDVEDKQVLDAALIAAGQAAEHYEIDSLRHARRLGAAAWPQRLRERARAEPRGGEGGRQEALIACRKRHQPQGGVRPSGQMRKLQRAGMSRALFSNRCVPSPADRRRSAVSAALPSDRAAPCSGRRTARCRGPDASR